MIEIKKNMIYYDEEQDISSSTPLSSTLSSPTIVASKAPSNNHQKIII